MKSQIVLIVILLTLTGTALSQELIVPNQFPTIQAAIDHAFPGCTILVMPGTYVENINFLGKPITVKSMKGPGETVIDGGQAWSVVTFENNETQDAVLEGFTITNGSGTVMGPMTYGGGIYCDNASPTITSNVLYQNTASWGGAIYCQFQAAPVIINNIIRENNADTGGGICCDFDVTATLTNNTLHGNSALLEGGGIWCGNLSDIVVTNTVLWENSAPLDDEICVVGANPSVTYCDVQGGWPGTTNIDADPEFADPSKGDLHIPKSSPCYNKGDENAPELPEWDFEGDSRTAYGTPITGTPDMGADEYFACSATLYITPHGTSGSTVELHFGSGPPGSAWVMYYSFCKLPLPWKTPYGYWYLGFPLYGFSGVFPPSTTIDASAVLPSIPIPFTLHWQGGVACILQLTNLQTMTLAP